MGNLWERLRDGRIKVWFANVRRSGCSLLAETVSFLLHPPTPWPHWTRFVAAQALLVGLLHVFMDAAAMFKCHVQMRARHFPHHTQCCQHVSAASLLRHAAPHCIVDPDHLYLDSERIIQASAHLPIHRYVASLLAGLIRHGDALPAGDGAAALRSWLARCPAELAGLPTTALPILAVTPLQMQVWHTQVSDPPALTPAVASANAVRHDMHATDAVCSAGPKNPR